MLISSDSSLMEKHHPSTLLSMDSSASSSRNELDLTISPQAVLTRLPGLNHTEHRSILDIGLGTPVYETAADLLNVPKVGKKCAKRADSTWGAWFFFSFYFKPALNDKSEAKVVIDSNGVSGFNKSDLQLDTFMVQHDLENMYMWAFKKRPENALGKMQLRSYMNGHSREGERPFPFSAERGFVRSHRMQRKHYRGLSNPQCIHGVEVVPSPCLTFLDANDRKRWTELTGRDTSFILPPEARDYELWRNLTSTEPITNLSTQNVGVMMDLSPVSYKRKKDSSSEDNVSDCHLKANQDRELGGEPQWLNEVGGVLRNANGPVTAAKAIYEDENGYLIVISLPLVELHTIKVTWRNTTTRGIIKVVCVSTSGTPFIKRQKRTFKLMNQTSEHCPPGEFVREIPLPTLIPRDAKLEAYQDGLGTSLEILVPKLKHGTEEHEIRVCLHPYRRYSELELN